jgi:hypothetical protein
MSSSLAQERAYRTRLRRWALVLVVLPGLAGPDPGAAPAEAPAAPVAGDPGRLLSILRPDYGTYIDEVRLFDGGRGQRIYMALVRPGATDPTRPESAPFAGPGARNDILYDRGSVSGGRSLAWSLLLLDHEYFHARHLAGTTSLPLAGRADPDVERHFYEAAAWGFNVGEARAGRYPGLRPDEFREALDRYGEHYLALRDLVSAREAGLRGSLSDLLRAPAGLLPAGRVTMSGSPRPAVPARLSGPGRSSAIP